MLPCLCTDIYQQERDSLTAKEIDVILEAGRKWDLSTSLKNGGIAVFPHTYIRECGHFIAACVHGALDSGKDHVLALGVLHSFYDELMQARNKEKAGEDVSKLPLRMVHKAYKDEYSLHAFEFLWNEEIKRRGIKAPKLISRYPYLVNQSPHTLSGIDELLAIASDAAVVATSDFCHHGVAYGIDKDHAVAGTYARDFALRNIKDHLDILSTGDLVRYYKHCQEIRSDSFDVGSIIWYLCGAACPIIHDVAIVDTAPLYEGMPSPSWVAASLVEFKKDHVHEKTAYVSHMSGNHSTS